MPVAASALALAMVSLSAGSAQAATHEYSGARVTLLGTRYQFWPFRARFVCRHGDE